MLEQVSTSGALLIGGLKLGELSYETLSEDVYNASKFADAQHICSAALGGKVGSAKYGGATRHTIGHLETLYVHTAKAKRSESAVASCKMDIWAQVTLQGDGAPASPSWVRYVVTADRVAVELRVLDKVPTRFNEAAWIGFEQGRSSAHSLEQQQQNAMAWELTKLGTTMTWDDVVRGGSPQMHAVDFVSAHYPASTSRNSTSNASGTSKLQYIAPRVMAREVTIDSLDAPLLSAVGIGRYVQQRTLLNFTLTMQNQR
eukprot:COSAG02_NODE_269_length_26468_cov_4.489021_6_plen_258_part_00